MKRADLHTALKSNVPVSMQLSAVLLLKELVYCILQVHLMKESSAIFISNFFVISHLEDTCYSVKGFNEQQPLGLESEDK